MDRREVVSGMVASTALLAVAPSLATEAPPPAPVSLSIPPTFEEATAYVWAKCQGGIKEVTKPPLEQHLDAVRIDFAGACTRIGDKNQPREPWVDCSVPCYDIVSGLMGELYVAGMMQEDISKVLCHVRDTYLKVPVSLLPLNRSIVTANVRH